MHTMTYVLRTLNGLRSCALFSDFFAFDQQLGIRDSVLHLDHLIPYSGASGWAGRPALCRPSLSALEDSVVLCLPPHPPFLWMPHLVIRKVHMYMRHQSLWSEPRTTSLKSPVLSGGGQYTF